MCVCVGEINRQRKRSESYCYIAIWRFSKWCLLWINDLPSSGTLKKAVQVLHMWVSFTSKNTKHQINYRAENMSIDRQADYNAKWQILQILVMNTYARWFEENSVLSSLWGTLYPNGTIPHGCKKILNDQDLQMTTKYLVRRPNKAEFLRWGTENLFVYRRVQQRRAGVGQPTCHSGKSRDWTALLSLSIIFLSQAI